MHDDGPRHEVTFYSPGTLFDESTTVPIGGWDVALAVSMAGDIVGRYGSRPYAFSFRTYAPGGGLDAAHMTGTGSGRHHICGVVRTLDEVVAENKSDEEILRSNMVDNGWDVIVDTATWYRHTAVFGPTDVVVDRAGEIIRRGDDADLVAFRIKMAAARERRHTAMMATAFGEITQDGAIKYLLAHGWRSSPDIPGPTFQSWAKTSNAIEHTVDVPLMRKWSDYARRMREAVDELSRVDGRSQREIALEMLGLEPTDLPTEIAVMAANAVIKEVRVLVAGHAPAEDLTDVLCAIHAAVQEAACTVLGDPKPTGGSKCPR